MCSAYPTARARADLRPPRYAPFIAELSAPTSSGWLELALDYRCNLRCLGCRSCFGEGPSMTAEAALAHLAGGAARGIKKLWIGGGEPTLRDDLPRLVSRARAIGFTRVLLQTNGLRLSYPRYTEALVRAGVGEFSLNVKSHRADLHDSLSSMPGAFELVLEALAVLGPHQLPVAADVLLTRQTIADLPQTVSFFASRGVRRFLLWLLSSADQPDASVAAEVPTLTECAPFVEAAIDVAVREGVELATLHTLPCTLSPRAREHFLPARALGLTVVDPSGRVFPLESSPFEGGASAEACARCGEHGRCGGPRADYVAIHGQGELAAIARSPVIVPTFDLL